MTLNDLLRINALQRSNGVT